MRNSKYMTLPGAVVALLAWSLASPLRAESSPCPEGFEKFIGHRLFFGCGSGNVEVVGDEAWDALLATEITSRFPDGLTVLDVAGQWREDSGNIIRERAKLVIILAPPHAGAGLRAREIAESYKRSFNQQSVLRTSSEVCATF